MTQKKPFQYLMTASAAFFVVLPGWAESPQKNTKPTDKNEVSKTQGSDFQNRKGGRQGSNMPYGHTVTEISNQGTHGTLENKKSGGDEKAILMSDPEILAVLKSMNKTEVAFGEMAGEKAKNDSVQHMGNQSRKDHGDLNLALSNIQKKTKIAPKENPISQSIEKMAGQKVAEFKSLEGEKFDQAYLQYEIRSHQEFLKLIDSRLLPNAKSEDLKTILKKTRISALNHLQHSEYTRNSIKYPM